MRMTPEQFKHHMAITKTSSPQGRMQALGRMKPGQMNKTETRYAQHLDAEKLAGEILWWCFEGIKLKLADNTHLTVDFFVMRKGGALEAHDVKAAKHLIQDDAHAKMKIAAEKFPFRFCYVYAESRTGHSWLVQEV